MLNVFLGYEQANKYRIINQHGSDVGFIAEEDSKISNALLRQLLRNRRSFQFTVLDAEGNEVVRLERPVKYFFNSRMEVVGKDGEVVGEVHQVWHLWRRKYDLFIKNKQFARIDNGFLAWEFQIVDANNTELASVNRNFVGFARELFTDSGQYAIRMDSLTTSPPSRRQLSLDERAVVLGCAVNIDIDYFSRLSNNHGYWSPFPFVFWGGGGSGGDTTTGTGATGDVGTGAVMTTPDITTSGGVNPFPVYVPGQDSSLGSSPPPPPTPTSPASENQWGDAPFLSDEEANRMAGMDTNSMMNDGMESGMGGSGAGGLGESAGEGGGGGGIGEVIANVWDAFFGGD
ncbi:hypothetical protein HK098_006666 [Nowakowskiella sp. JEL0407]|nr:hypothetical protein HK098_006666 [Nowakowskiella sp. JEL0407]